MLSNATPLRQGIKHSSLTKLVIVISAIESDHHPINYRLKIIYTLEIRKRLDKLMFMNFFATSIALFAIPAVALHAGVDKKVRTSALLNSVSATGDYFNNLGTVTRNSGGLPDFSLMKAP